MGGDAGRSQEMPRRGQFLLLSPVFVLEALALGPSKPPGHPSLAGVAARGESRVLKARSGFKST